MAIIERERSAGGEVSCIVQFGGQTPLKLALAAAGGRRARSSGRRPIRSTWPRTASGSRSCCWDLGDSAAGQRHGDVARGGARGRRRRSASRSSCGRRTCSAGAAWRSCTTRRARPLHDRARCDASHEHPVLIDRFLEDAFEFDVDAVADATGAVVIGGIMEHIEEAGIHSGDSSCVVPPFMVAERHLATIRDYTRRIARALKVVGLMNVAVRDQGRRGLRARGEPARVAHRAVPVEGDRRAAGEGGGARDGGPDAGRARPGRRPATPAGVFVKSPVFPFVRFPGVDTMLGPEMKSTGEVMGGADELRRGVREGAARRRAAAAAEGHRVHQREQQRQADRAADRARPRGARASRWWRRAAPRRSCARTASTSRSIYKVNEGRPERRRPDRQPQDRHGHQHAARPRVVLRRSRGAAGGDDAQRAVHHDADRRVGGGERDPRAAARRRSRCGRCRTTTPASKQVPERRTTAASEHRIQPTSRRTRG